VRAFAWPGRWPCACVIDSVVLWYGGVPFGRSKVSFADEYLKPASVEWQDFQTMDEAVAYAPQRFE
jgi:hypothetical protein